MSETPQVSVVVATFNRPDRALRLLSQLAGQDYPRSSLEVVVVDDGSAGDCAARLRAAPMPCRFEVIAQDNQGPARARHRGILAARGEIVVLLDDDMQVSPTFVAAHVRYHRAGARRVVLGRMRPDPGVDMPLYERSTRTSSPASSRGFGPGRYGCVGLTCARGTSPSDEETTSPSAGSTPRSANPRTPSSACGWRSPAASSSSATTRTP